MSKKYTTNFLEDTNGSTGSANQVLVSTAAGIDWVDGSGSGIIGGPYLPLAGGTMTGTGSISMPDNFSLLLGGGIFKIFNDGSNSIIRSQGEPLLIDANDITFRGYSPYNSLMTIKSSGNVGIGTTSPGAKLEVRIQQSVDESRQEIQRWSHLSENSLSLFAYGGTKNLLQFGGWNSEQNIAIVTDTLASISDTSTKGIYIKTGGNVGIGTTSPGTKLYVDGGESTFNRGNSAGTIATFRGQNAVKAVIGTATSYFTGNVGIGTTSPTANLQISSANDGMNNGINTNQLKLSHGVSTAGYGSSLAFGVSSIDQFTGAKIVHERTASNSVGDLSFWTRQTSGNSTDYDLTVERMRILANGNVGIGTTGPVNKIQANYSPVAIASLTASAGTSSTNWNRNAFLMGTGASVSNALAFGVSGTANDRKAWIQSGHPDSAANSLGTISLNPLGGNVGIGTTSPDFKLDVNGDVRISSDQTNLIKISNESNEDYFNVSQSTNNKPTLSLGDIDEQYGTLLTVDVENEEVVIFTNGQIYIGDNGFGNSTKFIVDDVNEKFTFTNGDVGIGTTSPSQKLEVDGNVKAETLIATDLTDGYVPYSKSGTLGLQDSKIYTQGAGIGVGTTTLAAGCHITSLSNISATGYRVSAMQTAPSSRGDTGTLGEIRITADYIYVCYATDSWKRVAIAQW
jgi:hypothetical protein